MLALSKHVYYFTLVSLQLHALGQHVLTIFQLAKNILIRSCCTNQFDSEYIEYTVGKINKRQKEVHKNTKFTWFDKLTYLQETTNNQNREPFYTFKHYHSLSQGCSFSQHMQNSSLTNISQKSPKENKYRKETRLHPQEQERYQRKNDKKYSLVKYRNQGYQW